MFKQAAERKYG